MIDFKALGAKAVANGADQTKSVAGGGDYTPPAAGPGLARFVGYVEIGKQKGTMKGVPTLKEKVLLIFELVGKRHAVAEGEQPHRITVEETYSLNEKANFFKLFQRMNYRQDAQHIVQLLGEGYKVEVVHDKWTGKDTKERVTAQLRNATGYTIAPPRKEDEDSATGWVDVAVPPAQSSLRCFLWNEADMQQWGSIFVEGQYPERKDKDGVVTAPAKSKNTLQARIQHATNFQGSPIHTLLAANGVALDLPAPGEDPDKQDEAEETPAAQTPATPAAKAAPTDDALGGIV